MKSKKQLAEEYGNSLFTEIKEYSRVSYEMILNKRNVIASFIAGYDKALQCAIERLKETMDFTPYEMTRQQTKRCINELIDLKHTKNQNS